MPVMKRNAIALGGKTRRALRLVGWNALLLAAGAALPALVGEAYFRRQAPFPEQSYPPREFVPEVGLLWKPDTEMRFTNRLDYWNVTRSNSLGFLDREPAGPERAAAGCHIAVIGDSFVEALQVPIASKFHVRLEQLAADALPRLAVSASAFGLVATGQIQQLALYDEYARPLRPKLIVLVFVGNDFVDNAAVLRALEEGRDPDRLPYAHAARRPDGTIELRPPRPYYEEYMFPRLPGQPKSWSARAGDRAARISLFANWLRYTLNRRSADEGPDPRLVMQAALLRQRPCCAALLAGWRPTTREDLRRMFTQSDLPPVFEDALDYTVFALRQFKQRAERGGAKLVILSSHHMKVFGTRGFERMRAMAAALDIPVIDQADYILRQGFELKDARWRRDMHWNPDGHQWAAEALLEWLRDNREVCAGAAADR